MKLFFLLVSLLSSIIVKAQCPPGDVSLTSQFAVNDFVANYPDCTTINGYLRISGASITDISGLDDITTINSYLLIGSNSFTSLAELANLQTIGGFLNISGSSSGSNFIELNNLTTVTDYVIIQNTSLTTLNMLNNLSSIGGSLRLNNNSQLTSLTGLENLTSVGDRIEINNNDAITNLSGLNNVATIGSSLHITGSDALLDLTSLETATFAPTQIWIQTNNSLTSIEGIQNIDLSGLTFLNITGSSNLSYCEVANICNYLDNASNNALITSNNSGCNSRPEVETACNALPVELITFKATTKNSHIHLHWQTASELNNQGFQLQKSKDGINWQDVVFIEGKGTTATKTEYQYTDVHPFSGTSYYRLRQVDFDEVFEYSNVVSVRLDKKPNDLIISPNPASELLTINLPELEAPQEVNMQIKNLRGQVLKEISSSFNTSFEVDVSALPKGVYLIQVNNTLSSKFVKI